MPKQVPVYSAALDHILAGLEHIRSGRMVKASKRFARAMQEEDYQQTLDVLDAQQQQALSPQDQGLDDDNFVFDQDQQDVLSRALARVHANAESVTAAGKKPAKPAKKAPAKKSKQVRAGEEGNDSGEEDAGAGEFENEGDDATTVTVEHADADSSGDDDATSSGDRVEGTAEDDDSETDQAESAVMSAAKERLKRQTKAAANLDSLGRRGKK